MVELGDPRQEGAVEPSQAMEEGAVDDHAPEESAGIGAHNGCGRSNAIDESVAEDVRFNEIDEHRETGVQPQ